MLASVLHLYSGRSLQIHSGLDTSGGKFVVWHFRTFATLSANNRHSRGQFLEPLPVWPPRQLWFYFDHLVQEMFQVSSYRNRVNNFEVTPMKQISQALFVNDHLPMAISFAESP